MTLPAKTAATALVAALLASGCSGSGTSDPLSASKAKTAAAAINLVDADAPAAYTGKPAESTGSSAEGKELASCVGAHAPGSGDVADVSSKSYTAGAAPLVRTLSSEVTVVRSVDSAKSDLKAYQSSKAKGCLSTVFTTLFKDRAKAQAGVTFGATTVTALPAPSGTDGSFGYTIEAPLMFAGTTLPVEVTLVGFLRKHCKVSFMTLSIGSTFNTRDRDTLVRTLVTRATSSAI